MRIEQRKLMPHQRWAINQLATKPGLFLPCGVGKTLTAIRYVRKHKLFPVLVICRKDDVLTWVTELEKEGYNDKYISAIRRSTGKINFSRWTIITYDLVGKLRKELTVQQFKAALADESYMIKRWKTKRTKNVIGVTKNIPTRIPMTATPTTKRDLTGVFSQSLFMDGGKTFGTSYWSFLKKYYTKLPHGGWCLKRGAKEQIIELFEKLSLTVDADSVIKLPRIRRLTKSAPISGNQMRLQDSLIDEWEYKLHGQGPVELKYVIAQLTKLQQIASGFIYDKSGKAHWVKSYKLDLLKNIVTDNDVFGTRPKIVVWCAFTAEIERIASEFSSQCVAFYGKKDKDRARKAFERDKSIRFFVGQVDSAVGMNELIVADTAIYFSNSQKVLSRKQSEGRIRRKGSDVHQEVTYCDLVIEGSRDFEVLTQLRDGVSMTDYVLRKLREGQSLSAVLGIRG